MSQDYRPLVGTDLLADSPDYINGSDEALRTGFAGASAPASPVAYQVWIDTANGYIKQRNAANDAWIVVGVLGAAYGGTLPLSGGTMSGPVDMGGQILSNLGLGTGLAAARVQEVALKAPIDAPVFTGDARVSQDPAGNDSIIRRSYAEGRYLKLSGGTMTGPIVLAGNAAADLQAVPYQQLRDFVLFNATTGHRHDGTDSRKVKGTSINSESAVSGRPLIANGTGGSTWGAWAVAGLILHNEPYTVASHSPTGGDVPWTELDVSASVPDSTAFAALVQVHMTEAATLKFRRYGTSVDATAQTWAITSGALDVLAVVPIASSILNYRCDWVISGYLTLKVLGYFLGP